MFTRERLLPPSGRYRRAFTADELRLAGADAADAERSAGVTSLAFSGPRWNLRFAIEWGDAQRPPCRGRVELRRGLVELRWNPGTPCVGYVGFSWRLEARGDLVLVNLDRRSEPAWVANAYRGTWKRVDCVTEPGILFTPGAYTYEKGKLQRLRLKLRELAEHVREARGTGVQGDGDAGTARAKLLSIGRKIALLEERFRLARVLPRAEWPSVDASGGDRSRPC